MNRKKYLNELRKAMKWLGKRDTVFLGQTCEYNGSSMYASLEDVDISKIYPEFDQEYSKSYVVRNYLIERNRDD